MGRNCRIGPRGQHDIEFAPVSFDQLLSAPYQASENSEAFLEVFVPFSPCTDTGSSWLRNPASHLRHSLFICTLPPSMLQLFVVGSFLHIRREWTCGVEDQMWDVQPADGGPCNLPGRPNRFVLHKSPASSK